MNNKKVFENVWRLIVFGNVSAGMYFLFKNLGENTIKAFLDIYKGAVELFFGNYHYYNAWQKPNGYVGNGYIISDKCLGLNIIVLIFMLLYAVVIWRFKGFKQIIGIIASGAAAVIIGVLANILRLLSSVYFAAFAKFEMIHALLGIVIYLSVLILCYVLSKKIFIDTKVGEDNE